jgi:hypothetical protein
MATTPTTLGKPQNVALAVAAASGVALTRTPRTPLAAQTAWLWTCQPGPWLGFGRALTALAGAEPGFEYRGGEEKIAQYLLHNISSQGSKKKLRNTCHTNILLVVNKISIN